MLISYDTFWYCNHYRAKCYDKEVLKWIHGRGFWLVRTFSYKNVFNIQKRPQPSASTHFNKGDPKKLSLIAFIFFIITRSGWSANSKTNRGGSALPGIFIILFT